jgi:hypothetical protein
MEVKFAAKDKPQIVIKKRVFRPFGCTSGLKLLHVPKTAAIEGIPTLNY